MGNKKGWRKPVDLTTTEYKQLKKNGMTDGQIATLAGIGKSSFQQWKKEHGVTGIRLKSKELIHPVTSRGEKRYNYLVIRIKELRDRYWSNDAIANELDISAKSVSNIIKINYPEEMRKPKTMYTVEQKERIKKAGVTTHAVQKRIAVGMSFDEALDTPTQKKRLFTKEQYAAIKKSGINRKTVVWRVKNGMTFEEAVTIPLNSVRRSRKK